MRFRHGSLALRSPATGSANMVAAGWVAVCWLAAYSCMLLAGCPGRAPEPRARRHAPSVEAVAVPVSKVILRDADFGAGAGTTESPEARILPAAIVDDAYNSSELTPARRLVYRVTFAAPGVLSAGPRSAPRTVAELYVDVSGDRLRARFKGPGWPVPDGSEVRLDHHEGAYAFDDRGGRPFAAGQLARWFFGGEVADRFLPPAGVVPAATQERVGPGALVCALVSEWAGQPRLGLARRCAHEGAPLRFRVGPWRAERTADVPIEVPRADLRSDHLNPPKIPAPTGETAIASDTALDRVLLSPRLRARSAAQAPPPPVRHGSLAVQNRTEARTLITVHGVPVQWFDAGESGNVSLPEGRFVVGAMRAFGNPVRPPRPTTVPGEFILD
jgi:hypothetical protein